MHDRFDGDAPHERPRSAPPDFAREIFWHVQGALNVAGLDEVGRGALAGPVLAAAVILPPSAGDDPRLASVHDSKRLAPAARAAAARAVHEVARAVALGAASAAEIDALGIGAATHLAMRRALAALGRPVAVALVDGRPVPRLAPHQEAIVGGDGLVLSIACASVVAKVARDGLLVRAGLERPVYGLGTHKGYGTAAHLAALCAHGPAACHRRTWQPVAALRRP